MSLPYFDEQYFCKTFFRARGVGQECTTGKSKFRDEALHKLYSGDVLVTELKATNLTTMPWTITIPQTNV